MHRAIDKNSKEFLYLVINLKERYTHRRIMFARISPSTKRLGFAGSSWENLTVNRQRVLSVKSKYELLMFCTINEEFLV